MNRYSLNKTTLLFLLAIIVMVVVFAPVAVVHAQTGSALSGIAAWFTDFGDLLHSLLASLGNIILSFFGLILWASGVLLNQTLALTVASMGEFVRDIGAINTSWVVVRDVANLVLIFALLAIGIGTILQIERYGIRSLLVKVIIAALLINFSLFFTKVVIDTSNLLALQFYTQTTNDACQVEQGGSFLSLSCGDGGVSDRFMEALKLPTLYDITRTQSAEVQVETPLDVSNVFLVTLFGSIFILITAFIFFAASILLIIRFVVLIFLMVLSPLAFAAMVLPKTQGYAKDWWDALFNQSFFAPLYLLLTFVALSIVEDEAFPTNVEDANFAAALNGDGGSVIVFMNFAIVAALMIGTLVIAKKLSAVGSSTMIKWGHSLRQGAQGFAGRNTLGRAGLLADNLLRTTKFGSTGIGQAIRRGTTGALAGAKFGSDQSIRDAKKRDREDIEQTVDSLKKQPEQLGRFISGLNREKQSQAYSKLSARDRAAAENYLDPTRRVLGGAESKDQMQERLRGAVSTEEQEKTKKASDDAQTAKDSKDIRDNIDTFVKGGRITLRNPATNAPYQIHDLIRQLKVSDTRKLSSEARKSAFIVQNLSPQQLRDLQNNGDLKEDEIASIVRIVNGPMSYPNQTLHRDFINDPANKILWNL